MRFTNQDYQSFKTLVRLNQDKLRKTLYLTLAKTYGRKKVKNDIDYIYAIGDIPVALVAHMDTVFPVPPQDIYFDRAQGIMWSPDGLGADDRAGVFSILKIISEGYMPHIIFTSDEELGARGALQLSKIPCPFKDLRFIIELDRRGVDDCVFYDCANEEFEKFIEEFGFHSEWGSFSDISEICPAWGVAGVNLSVGYQDEHSYVETLNVRHLLETVEKVKNILDVAPQVSQFKYIKGNRFLLNYFTKCSICGKVEPNIEMIDVYDADYHKKYICGNCLDNENVEWCEDCYEGFEPGVLNKVTGLCPRCAEKDRNRGYTKICM